MFRVVTLLEIPPPAHDPITQFDTRDGAELVNGQWQYKWKIVDLTPEQIASNIAIRNAALIRSVQDKTQARLDAFAQTRNYAGILSLCTYAASANPKFQQEGQYGVEARDLTWSKLYEILAAVQAGTRPVPAGYAEIEGELPALVWPE
jgi:hypothetical protein